VKIIRASHVVVWATLLIWFAARDAPNLFKELRHSPAIGFGPNASMNYFLEALLAVPRPVDRLDAVLAQLPRSSPIVFVSPKRDDDRRDFVYYAMCYLGWPRSIDRVNLDAREQLQRADFENAITIFYNTKPAIESLNRWTIGPHLVVIQPAKFK
jgi:hypothetical protein